jgi:hypothetical protein
MSTLMAVKFPRDLDHLEEALVKGAKSEVFLDDSKWIHPASI